MALTTNQGGEIDPLLVITGGDLMGLVDDLPTLGELQQQQQTQNDSQTLELELPQPEQRQRQETRVAKGVWATIDGIDYSYHEWLHTFSPDSFPD